MCSLEAQQPLLAAKVLPPLAAVALYLAASIPPPLKQPTRGPSESAQLPLEPQAVASQGGEPFPVLQVPPDASGGLAIEENVTEDFRAAVRAARAARSRLWPRPPPAKAAGRPSSSAAPSLRLPLAVPRAVGEGAETQDDGLFARCGAEVPTALGHICYTPVRKRANTAERRPAQSLSGGVRRDFRASGRCAETLPNGS